MRPFVICLASLLLGGGCGPRPPQVRGGEIDASKLPQFLRPVSGASGVYAAGGDGVFAVGYDAEVAYPAASVLAEIETSIPSHWTPRKENSLNPGIPTSHVRGWTGYRDLTTKPESWVHAWQSEWQNEAGDLLSYSLIYRSTGPFPGVDSLATPRNSNLRVTGQVVPRAIKEQMHRFARSQAERFEEQHQ